MPANRTQFFYQAVTLDADYSTNTFKMNGNRNHLKIINDGGNPLDFSLVGGSDNTPQIDGTVAASEAITFDHLDFDKLSLKSALGTDCRVWAWN